MPSRSACDAGAMQQIADWLQKLGLGQYAQRFAENDINFAVLPHLTDQDLKELGVASLGHRRQLLLAIAELNGIQKGAVQRPSSTEVPIAPQDAAERRQVTVMFSDLVGSTALSARMDPEDLREVISAYQKCVAETVRRFGGFVAKYMGDGVLVYFGYPEAHEDDAAQAVRAGHDPGVCARTTGGQAEWLLGYPHRAVASTEEGLALAEQIAHPFSRGIALEYAGFVRLNRGEPELGLAHWATADALRTEHRVAFAIDPLFFRGAAQIAQGAAADAAASIHESFQPGRLGTHNWRPYGLCIWAQALAQQGSYLVIAK